MLGQRSEYGLGLALISRYCIVLSLCDWWLVNGQLHLLYDVLDLFVISLVFSGREEVETFLEEK